MIVDDQQLRIAIESIARMYRLREREAMEPLWDPETRADVAADTDSMMQSIEREIAAYLMKKYAIPLEQSEKAA
jgi:hypothetical protein